MAYSIAMIFDLILSFAILGYSQVNAEEEDSCPDTFIYLVDIHIYYKQLMCTL